MWMVLAALGALGVSGYVYLKPVREAAQVASSTVDAVKGQTDGLVRLPGISDRRGYTDNQSQSLSGVAQSFLPPGAFALYSHLSKQEGGITGFLSNLQNKDLQSVIDEVKKVGGDDAKRIIEKVEKRLKEAKGDVQKMDWRSLVEELKAELPAGQQKLVDVGPSMLSLDQVLTIRTLSERSLPRRTLTSMSTRPSLLVRIV